MKEVNAATENVTKWCDGLKFNRFHFLLMALLGSVLIFDGYDTQIVAYIMPHVMKEWQLSPVELGSIASYGFVGLMIGAGCLGTIADRVGRKITVIISLLIFAVFSGASYFAPSFSTLCALRLAAGVGLGGAMPLTVTLMSEYSPARIRARATTAMFTGLHFGFALSALLAMAVVPVYGWRPVLLIGGLPIFFIPILMIFLPESLRFLINKGRHAEAIKALRRIEKAAGVGPINWTPEALSQQAVPQGGSVRELFSHGLMSMTILIWLTYFLNLMIIYAFQIWLPTLLVKAGFSLVRSYSYIFAVSIGYMIGSYVLSWVMDIFGRKAGLVFAYILGGAAIAVFGSISSTVALYIVGALIGFAIGGAQTTQHVVTAEIYPTRVRSTGVGWALTMGRLGSIVGPLLGGALVTFNFTFQQYFIVFAIPCFLCSIFVLFYKVNIKHEALEEVTAKLAGKAMDGA